MFTGIIDHCGEIIEVGNRLLISTQFNDFVLGESIAVDGVCLTVTDFTQNQFTCDLSPETLNLIKSFKIGHLVNLEKSLKLSDRMGGHMVMGHVDTKAVLEKTEKQGDFFSYQFGQLPKETLKFIAKKGSIAVNGVSLTVNHVNQESFEVMLIPHTLEKTNLSSLVVGDEVNIELDYFARYIINYLESQKNS